MSGGERRSEYTSGWTHNNHYHAFLLDQVPAGCAAALDIGCGAGEFAGRLAQRCGVVDAIDPDRRAIAWAGERWSSLSNVRWHAGRFEKHSWKPERYDFVSAIASLHHINSALALPLMKRVLKPGGVIAILGLYREATLQDLLYSAMAAPLNAIYLYKHKTRSHDRRSDAEMVVKPPHETLAEIRELMNEAFPEHRFSRHLFWRYSVIWKKS